MGCVFESLSMRLLILLKNGYNPYDGTVVQYIISYKVVRDMLEKIQVEEMQFDTASTSQTAILLQIPKASSFRYKSKWQKPK